MAITMLPPAGGAVDANAIIGLLRYTYAALPNTEMETITAAFVSEFGRPPEEGDCLYFHTASNDPYLSIFFDTEWRTYQLIA